MNFLQRTEKIVSDHRKICDLLKKVIAVEDSHITALTNLMDRLETCTQELAALPINERLKYLDICNQLIACLEESKTLTARFQGQIQIQQNQFPQEDNAHRAYRKAQG